MPNLSEGTFYEERSAAIKLEAHTCNRSVENGDSLVVKNGSDAVWVTNETQMAWGMHVF